MRISTIPEWLKNLSPGIYKINDLKKFTPLDQACIRRQLVKHGAFAEKQYDKNGHLIIVYYWEGFKECLNTG